MKRITMRGQTVEEAVEKALAQLHVSKEAVDIVVVQQEKKPFLGLFGGQEAIVEVTVSDPFHCVQSFLKQVIEQMNVRVQLACQVEGERLVVLLSGPEVARVIGKHGQTLNALQLLAQGVLNRYTDRPLRVVIDAEGYRKRREETLVRLAKNMAKKAIQTGKDISLEPMSAWERKVIHTALSDDDRIQTFSAGTEPHRHVVISLKR
ncbi:SpoIIIJ-associated RNA binding protein Jag [Anoxybacillus flavithermus NBRC 109594]|uniref:RNA-binding protein KhpB n=1 Tax=Anoxybacillus flavithermus NBRC 109594 TaxID=1315967 RepID=R4FCF2_9BACL|nr:RNA-binding cell elongation regulator Jag/EloR [Anoxybacillus flavithermus]GAC91166.1 SpoIIIJ-associated RNA binding protein Jag [Anoxybacillus flavithermus NBRC 109594]